MEPKPLADRTPWPDAWTVRDGRDAYLRENGFSIDEYEAPSVTITVLGRRLKLPNPRSRRAAIPMHDLHHVVTGFGTDLVGEAEVSAWELRRGLRGLGLYPRLLVTFAALTGLFIAPRRALRAWRGGRRGRTLFERTDDYEALLRRTIGQLREELEIAAGGLAHEPRCLHEAAPARG